MSTNTTTNTTDSISLSQNTLTIDQVVSAVQTGDLNIVNDAISTQGISPNARDKEDCSLLHWAAINNRVAIVELLLKLGADVNVIGGVNREIPLQWAVRRGDAAKIVSMLIIHKSELNHRSIYGYDALYLAAMAGHVHLAYLLLNAGANVNTTDNNENQLNSIMHFLIYEITKSTPPSMMATSSTHAATPVSNDNQIDLVRLFLRFGTDLTMKNALGLTPIHILAKHGSFRELDLAFTMCSEAMYTSLFRCWNNGNTKPNSGVGGDPDSLPLYHNPQQLSIAAAIPTESPLKLAWKEKNRTMIKFFLDFYMYAYLPFSLPIMLTAISFASMFPLLDYFGWFHGAVLLGFPACFTADALSQASIIAKNSRSSAGVAVGVILALTYCYFHHIARYHTKNFNTMVMILVGIIFITLWKSMRTPPLHLNHGDCNNNGNNSGNFGNGSLADKIITSEILYSSQNTTQYAGLKFKFCTTCLIDKSLASTHCSKCNLCIIDLDHHCPFVCNCVGRGNRRMFVYFTLFAAIGCLLVAITIFYAEYDHFCILEAHKSYAFFQVQKCMLARHPALLFGSWLGLNCFIWIFSIFWGQVSMVAAETTTYEVIKRHNFGKDCMTLRSLRNLIVFFRTGAYTVSPSEEGEGDGDEASVPLLVAEMREKEKERERADREREKERERSSKMMPSGTSTATPATLSMMRSSKGGADPMQMV